MSPPNLSAHGYTGASHPAIIKALQVYGRDWGEHSEHEQAFLKALRAADVKMIAAIEAAGRLHGFSSPRADRSKQEAALQRDADYAAALASFDRASELEEA